MTVRDDTAGAIVAVRSLFKHFVLPRETLFGPRGMVHAVNGVSLSIRRGRSFGVVGESGSGKSTLARMIMALEVPTSGTVTLLGRDVNAVPAGELRRLRRHFQMIFQDPYSSLDPRHQVGRIVAEPLDALAPASAAERREQVAEALESVGLKFADAGKYPHEFSGGQRQRIAIARALITRPDIIVADEPVSALDVSVQAQVLNLMRDLQQQRGITYLLISHDLAVVEHVCDEVAVMYLGTIVEQGPAERLFAAPGHPYTKALLDAVPRPVPGRRRRRAALTGAIGEQPWSDQGCPFASRCPLVEARCRTSAPALTERAAAHRVACHVV